ncbi:MAG TPA: hypothetical protein VH877_27570 [Polyangia bacterium]|nr:hypothetical protein [Polyangia bacterium]
MTRTDGEQDDEAFYAITAITLQMGKRSFNQQKRAYEAWLAKYIPQAEAQGRPEDVPRLRRLVAEWLIDEAVEAKRPASAFEPLVNNIEALGWENLLQKTLKISIICSYFADRMWTKEGLRYLLPLKREVENEYARTGDKAWAYYLNILARTERRLRSRKRPF